jgi:N,N'-diacetyllegionaminate synthase
MSVFIIAEAGVNHNGSPELAIQLVDIAAECGADAVKFQTFTANKLVKPGSEKAEYQKRQTGTGDQLSMLQALEMSPELHKKLFDRCGKVGIEFMSTPFDPEAAVFLKSIGMKRLKIPSGEIDNFPLLRFFAQLEMPLIMSTGMADLAEVEAAKNCIEAEWQRLGHTSPRPERLTILHCTSNYPADAADVNLRAMITMAEHLGYPVGYSDHTLGIAVSTAAVALGATVIEKHFTMDKNAPGPDHAASLTPDELAEMVRQIRTVERALGSFEKKPSASELEVRSLVRRSISVAHNVPVGTRLSMDDIVLLRPANGLSPSVIDDVIGRTVNRNLKANELLDWTDLT